MAADPGVVKRGVIVVFANILWSFSFRMSRSIKSNSKDPDLMFTRT
jgi:hypothetical protein